KGSKPPTSAQLGQPVLLLLLGAEPEDRHGTERDAVLQGDRHRGVHPRQFLERQAQCEVVTTHPAVLLREGQPEQRHRPHLRDQPVPVRASLVQLTDHRRDFFTSELLHGGPQRRVLRTQLPIHRVSSSHAPRVASACSVCRPLLHTASTRTTTSPRWTVAPGRTRTSRTTPSSGAVSPCSIFIASSTANLVPALTC